jgi:hypothetical protein
MKVSDVKVRVHELAEELDVSERTLINWLSRKGYPGARANDWLTPKLSRTARIALRRPDNTYARGGSTHKEGYSKAGFSQKLNWIETGNLGVLPSQSDLKATPAGFGDQGLTSPQLLPIGVDEDEANIEDGDLLHRERARSELLLKRIEGVRDFHEKRHQDLRYKYEQTIDERTQLRQTVYALNQNQETLDQTCRELSHELEHNRKEVSDLKQRLQAQEKMSNAIDKVTQQKQAWRARALALEEKVQTNQHLTTQLKELGMSTLEQQVRLFNTLLASPESASQLFNAIKMVEHEEVRLMVNRWVVKTCVNPLCNQVNTLRRKLSIRVDRAHHCEVCGGDSETRWFERMVVGCERAHIRRFLLVGGEALHTKIRALTEGKNVDFRLILSHDESSPQRIQSRLESCDLLLTWPRGPLSSEAGMNYRRIAPIVDCPLIDLNGDQVNLSTLSRHILNWVSRTGSRSDR